MARYISILRGINAGGRMKVGMAELRDLYLKLGMVNAATYIRNGSFTFIAPTATGNPGCPTLLLKAS
jgi:uncharacterized protein (DUF1697 family)